MTRDPRWKSRADINAREEQCCWPGCSTYSGDSRYCVPHAKEDRYFRERLNDLLHERRYGSAGIAVSDEELMRLVEELVEKVRPRP